MANFESGLGSKRIGNPHMKEYIVDEPQNAPFDMNAIRAFQNQMNQTDIPDEDVAHIEHDIRRQRAEKRSGKQRLDPGAKKRLEQLLGMVRCEKEVILNNDMVFVLHVLKSGELNEVMKETRKETMQFDWDYQMRRQNLARSIKSISNIPFSDFVGSEDMEDKLYFVDQLDDFVLTKLYMEYGALAEDAKNKYGLSTEEKQKEVLEDLKK